jgi:hypothetical protein
MRLAIAGGHWFIEVLCFYCKFVLADSLVLLNARHRQAQERYEQVSEKSAKYENIIFFVTSIFLFFSRR